MTARFLNLGCGDRFHPDWENVDFVATSPNVRVHDLTKPLPYPDETFEIVYHSHVLEHFPRTQARALVSECFRVLKRGGTIRIAVPDLECAARLYLEALEKASAGIPGWADKYEWMMLELYDQAVREEHAGGLNQYFAANPHPDWDFLGARMGTYGESVRKHFGAPRAPSGNGPIAWKYVFRHPGRVFRDPLRLLHRRLIRLILNDADWEALQIGRFRRQGEVHMWMYDRYSLRKLLEQEGFAHVSRTEAAESRIPHWSGFNIDTDPDGRIYKADSMYMEATKP
jgi:predicted SAM-dependent methyltransferase